ncbi:hypothetical protein TEK04_15870 [Klenkia sp. LSe6-5]|uniref:Uncharacterized protein n=1 Tax=Klenkia sesuvii TaxID=3103137 RepID=A0ABU8DWN1_9ACTN
MTRLHFPVAAADYTTTMDTTAVTLIPALLAPPAGACAAFPAHGRTAVSALTAGLLVRAVPTPRARAAA